MSEDDYLKIATRVLFTEARLLDQKKFRDWVKLYADDAIFWVPAWKDEYETTSNPNRELSMIYHENSYGLSDRIDRIQSRSPSRRCRFRARFIPIRTSWSMRPRRIRSREMPASRFIRTIRALVKAIPTSDALNFGCAVLERLG